MSASAPNIAGIRNAKPISLINESTSKQEQKTAAKTLRVASLPTLTGQRLVTDKNVSKR